LEGGGSVQKTIIRKGCAKRPSFNAKIWGLVGREYQRAIKAKDTASKLSKEKSKGDKMGEREKGLPVKTYVEASYRVWVSSEGRGEQYNKPARQMEE